MPSDAAPIRVRDVVVLKFRAPNVEDEPSYLGEGFAAGVANRLAALGALELWSTSPLDAAEPATPGEAQRIGGLTGARLILTGEVVRAGANAQVSVSIYRASDGARAARFEYAVAGQQLPALERRVAAAAASRILSRALTGDETAALGPPSATSSAAYDRFLLARSLATQRTSDALSRAAALFDEATRLEPSFAQAHARAALAYVELLERGWGQRAPAPLIGAALAHARRATTGNPRLAIGWAAWARAAALEPSLSATRGREAGARALELAPRDAEVVYAVARAHWNAGDATSAEQLLTRAVALDPARSAPHVDIADARAARRDWRGACAALNRAVSTDARDPFAYALRSLVRLRMGEARDAWADAETVSLLGRVADGTVGSAIVDAVVGDTARARGKLRAWLLVRGSDAPALSAWEGRLLGLAAAAAQRPDDAIELVRRVRPRGGLLRLALGDPGFDPIRAELHTALPGFVPATYRKADSVMAPTVKAAERPTGGTPKTRGGR